MEVLAHLIRAAPDLVKRTEHAGYDAQKIDEFGMALKDLLKRFKGEHRSQVSSLLEKQRVLSQRLGLMHSKEDPEGTAERLRGTRRKKGKGQSS